MLSEKIARLLEKDDGDIAMDDALGLLIEVQRVLDDPVAVVRRGVESGTIKGKVAESWHILNADYVKVDEPGDYIVIGPVSDGGEDRP